MNPRSLPLKPFERRVRLVRAWRGLALGLVAGGLLDAVWAVSDWLGHADTDLLHMGFVAGACGLLGALIGGVRKVDSAALTDSIDRRGELENRVHTAHVRSGQAEGYDDALHEDAVKQLAGLKPAKLYPVRVGRLQVSALACCLLAATVFLMGSTPLLLSEQAKKERAELKNQGEAVKRITKETFENPKDPEPLSNDEQALKKELEQLQRQLDKGRLSKEEALRKANDLSKQADELSRQTAEKTTQSLSTAQTAIEKMQKLELEKAGLGAVPPSMAQMSPAEREAAIAKAQQDIKDLAKKLSEAEKRLAEIEKQLKRKDLSAAQRKALEDEKKALEAVKADLQKQLRDAKNQEKALQLSKEAQEVFAKMMKDPIYKEIQELAKKLAKDAQAGKSGQKPPMTKAEREALLKKLEELAKQLKDPKAMKEYLEALREAIKNAKRFGRCNGLAPGINGMMGLSGMGDGPEVGAPSEDQWSGDRGWVHKYDKGLKGGGKTTESQVSGDRDETRGDETIVEIRAPATTGNRSSVPYRKVLPSYQKKAEQAIDRKQIPKEHQKRVKEYFESLGR